MGGCLEVVPIAANRSEVTLTTAMKLNGSASIPRFVLKSASMESLTTLTKMKKFFDRTLEIGEAERRIKVAMITAHGGGAVLSATISEEEKFLFDKGEEQFKQFKEETRVKVIKMRSPLSAGRLTIGGGVYGGTDVRASIVDVLAFVLCKEVDWPGRSAWKKHVSAVGAVSYLHVNEAESAWRIRKRAGEESSVEFVGKVGGVVGYQIVTEVQEYFQELRPMADYDEEDGRALGVRLMHPGGERRKGRGGKVRWVVEKHIGLKELNMECRWLVGFLEEVVRGRLWFSGTMDTKLDCLSEKEARLIGRSLMKALRARKTAEAGLYQWKMQNRSMVELFERYGWMESMMLEISRVILKTAPWGLMFRVSTGALLSVVDVVTDVVVIVGYMGKEETRGYGLTLLLCLVFSVLLQILLVSVQNSGNWLIVLREILVVLVGVKPGVDAYRVVTLTEKGEGQLVDAKTELVISKCIEMVCESIPGAVLLTYSVLAIMESGGRVPRQVIVSIVFSALANGYSSATIGKLRVRTQGFMTRSNPFPQHMTTTRTPS